MKEKTGSRAAKGVFLGYAQGTRGYRVWLIDEQKVVVSKDVVFNEDQLFKDLEKEKLNSKEEQKESVTKKKVTFRSVLKDICDGESLNSGGVIEEDQSQEHQAIEETESEEEDSDSGTVMDQSDGLKDYVLAIYRVRRTIKPPSKFEDGDFVA